MKPILASCALGLFLHAGYLSACTTILVGSEATIDGSNIIARNDDATSALAPPILFRHPAEKKRIKFVSNTSHNVTNGTFTTLLPPNTLGYLAFPRATTFNTTNLSFEETGINDFSTSISATESLTNSKAVLDIDPYTSNGITEDAITTVVLRQATSAEHGIKVLGKYIKDNGAGEGFGVALSDANETWYLETASGHHWVAQRLPKTSYFVSANQGRFQTINFDDTMNVLSSDIVSFLEKNHLYSPADGPLNLFKCCMANGKGDKNYNYPRVNRLQGIYSGLNTPNSNGLFPVFPQPTRKLSIKDVTAGLRDHYNDSQHDPYLHKNPDEPWRPISVLRASFSHVTQHFPGRPSGIATVQYIALGMADLSAYIPLYDGLQSIPPQYQGAGLTADDNSLFWKTRKLQALVFLDYPTYAPGVKAKLEQFEIDTEIRQETLVHHYMTIWNAYSVEPRYLIQDFTNDTLQRYEQLLASMTQNLAEQTGKTHLTNEQYTQLIDSIEKRYHFEGI